MAVKWKECRACRGYGRELGGAPNQWGERTPLHDAPPCAICKGEGRIYLDVARPAPPPQGQLIEGRAAEQVPEAALFGAEVPGIRLESRDDRPFCVGGVRLALARGFGASGLVLEVVLAHPEGWTNIDLARQVAGTYADAHKITWESYNPQRALAAKKRKCQDHNPASASYGQNKMLVASTWSFPVRLDSLVAARPELAGLGPYALVERSRPWSSELTRKKLGILTTPLRRNPAPPQPREVSMRRDPQSRPEWNQWVAVAGEWDMEASAIRNAVLTSWVPRSSVPPPHVKMLVPLDNIKGIPWKYRGRAEFPKGTAMTYQRMAKARWPTFVAETKLNLLEVLREAVPFSWPRIESSWWYVKGGPTQGVAPRLPAIEDMAMDGEWPRAPRTLAALREALGTVPRRVEGGRLVEVGLAERIWAYWRHRTRDQLLDLFEYDPVPVQGPVRDTGGFLSEETFREWSPVPIPPEAQRFHGLVGPLP